MLRIADMLDTYSRDQEAARDWSGHDRLDTVGASEAFQCIRRVAYDKAEIPVDDDYVQTRGAMDRGNIIEQHWIVPALTDQLPEGLALCVAGELQQTLVSGWLSCTPDGILLNNTDNTIELDGVAILPGHAILVEMKSVDPRVDLTEARMQHQGQVQVQAGIVSWATNYKIVGALLVYVNASFLDEITVFPVEVDEQIYLVAGQRAELLYSTIDETVTAENTAKIEHKLKPEGKIAGGTECRHCPWFHRCQGANVDRVPESVVELPLDLIARAGELVDAERHAYVTRKNAEQKYRATQEAIKDFLLEHGTKSITGPGWSIRWTPVKGRTAYDTEQMKKDGIEIEEYATVGAPSERLTVKGSVDTDPRQTSMDI